MLEQLNYIDIGILVVLVLLSIKDIWKGIIRGLASFLGILLGIFLASRFYEKVGTYFAENIYNLNSDELNHLIGFLILITLVWGVFLLLGEILYRALRFSPFAVLDGALGLIFGFCKAFLLISIIVYGVSQINWLQNFSQKVEKDSYLFPIMKHLAIQVMNIEQIQEINKNLNLDGKAEGAKETLKKGAKSVQKDIIDKAPKAK